MKASQSSLYRELENLMLWFIPVGNNIPKDFAWLAPQDVRTDEVVLEGGLRFGSLYEGIFTEEFVYHQ